MKIKGGSMTVRKCGNLYVCNITYNNTRVSFNSNERKAAIRGAFRAITHSR